MIIVTYEYANISEEFSVTSEEESFLENIPIHVCMPMMNSKRTCGSNRAYLFISISQIQHIYSFQILWLLSSFLNAHQSYECSSKLWIDNPLLILYLTVWWVIIYSWLIYYYESYYNNWLEFNLGTIVTLSDDLHWLTRQPSMVKIIFSTAIWRVLVLS